MLIQPVEYVVMRLMIIFISTMFLITMPFIKINDIINSNNRMIIIIYKL